MPEKSLIEVDVKIAELREKMAAGKATIQTGIELDALLQARGEFIQKLMMLRESSDQVRP
jgi:hypothetical protein